MKLGIQSAPIVFDFGREEGYKMISKAGFEAIDWNIDTLWNYSKVRNGDLSDGTILAGSIENAWEAIRPEYEIIRKNGLIVSQAHAPFPPYIPQKPELLDYAIPVYENCIRLCQKMGCKNLIIHGVSPQDCGNDAHKTRELNIKLYGSLTSVLVQTDVTVCLENIPSERNLYSVWREGACANPYDAADYIDTLNKAAGKECFGLCMDTGHINILGKTVSSFAQILGKRIKALHTHDNDGVHDLHLMPYSGTADWRDFYIALRNIGYTGDLCFETAGQLSMNRVDAEVVQVFLKAICETGQFFRKQIEKNA